MGPEVRAQAVLCLARTQKRVLVNLNIIPVRDISDEVDQSIVAWRSKFPLTVGAIDLALVGDREGYTSWETKLYGNQDKRKVFAQILDYAAGLWKQYSKTLTSSWASLKKR